MRGTQAVFLGLFGLAAMAMTAGPALAASIVATSEPEFVEAGFRLRGSHGYRITAVAYAAADERAGAIFLDARRAGDHVSYRAPATVTDDAVRADLGPIGKVDLIRRPSGREKTVRPKCLSTKLTYQPATYEGTVVFKGEEGYTSARATRLAHLPSWLMLGSGVCRGAGYGESIGANEPGARLRGVSYAHGRVLDFQVNKNRPGSRVLFSASLKERHNHLLIARSVDRTLSPEAFRFHPSLRAATLGRRPPFSGVGRLTRSLTSYSPIWTGNLALDFPGRSNVRLAGPGVHVTLAHARVKRSRGPRAEIDFGRARQIRGG